MATSGSFNTSAYTGSQNSPRYYTFSWSLVSQSISGNYSDISYSVKGAGGNSNNYWVNVREKYVTVNGSTQSNSKLQQTYNGTVAFSGTARIYHNSDGTKSFTASVGGAFESYGSYNSTGSKSFTLPTIARASVPSIKTYPSNTPDFNIGDKILIHMNRKSTSFTHKVYMLFGSINHLIATGVTNNCEFDTSTIASDMYAQIPNANVGTGSIKVETYNGSTLVGSKTCSLKAHVINSNPTAGAFTYKDSNSITTAITKNNQRIIREHSNLLFTIGSATALNSATISKYEVTFNGVTKSLTATGNLDFGTINLSSNATATLKVTDSRGNTATKEIEVIIDDWKLPTGLISLKRKNNFYSESYLKVDGTYSSLNGKNTMAIQYICRRTDLKESSYYGNLEDNVEKTLELDNNYQWHIQIIISDRLGQTTYNLNLDRGMPIVFFDRLNSSTSFNCFPTKKNSVELKGDFIIDAKSMLDFVHPIGSYYETDDLEFNPNTYWGGTWELEEDGTVLVSKSNVAGSKFNVDLGTIVGSETHTLTIAEMPKHRHVIPYSANTNAGYKSVIRSNGTEAEGFSPYQGQDQPHNNVQPSKVVNRWHRIA